MWSLQPYCKQLIIAVNIENYFKTAMRQTISHLNISFNFNINYICYCYPDPNCLVENVGIDAKCYEKFFSISLGYVLGCNKQENNSK